MTSTDSRIDLIELPAGGSMMTAISTTASGVTWIEVKHHSRRHYTVRLGRFEPDLVDPAHAADPPPLAIRFTYATDTLEAYEIRLSESGAQTQQIAIKRALRWARSGVHTTVHRS